MLLLSQELARARMRESEAEAAQVRLSSRLHAARKWERRARRATDRARLAAAAIR